MAGSLVEWLDRGGPTRARVTRSTTGGCARRSGRGIFGVADDASLPSIYAKRRWGGEQSALGALQVPLVVSGTKCRTEATIFLQIAHLNDVAAARCPSTRFLCGRGPCCAPILTFPSISVFEGRHDG